MKLPEYKSLEEKAPFFSHIKIDTKDVLDFNIEKLLEYSPNCIFRGVNEAFSEESMKRSISFTRLFSAVGFATVWAATPQ